MSRAGGHLASYWEGGDRLGGRGRGGRVPISAGQRGKGVLVLPGEVTRNSLALKNIYQVLFCGGSIKLQRGDQQAYNSSMSTPGLLKNFFRWQRNLLESLVLQKCNVNSKTAAQRILTASALWFFTRRRTLGGNKCSRKSLSFPRTQRSAYSTVRN